MGVDLQLRRNVVPAARFNHWHQPCDFSTYCACAFPTAVFAGGCCGYCNYSNIVNHAIRDLFAKDREGEKGSESIFYEESRQNDRRESTDYTTTAMHIVPTYHALREEDGQISNVRRHASMRSVKSTLDANKYDNCAICVGKDEPAIGVDQVVPACLIQTKSKPIPVPRRREDMSYDISCMERMELQERYDRATWGMYQLITQQRRRSNYRPPLSDSTDHKSSTRPVVAPSPNSLPIRRQQTAYLTNPSRRCDYYSVSVEERYNG